MGKLARSKPASATTIVNVEVPLQLHREAKEAANRDGRLVRAVYAEALAYWLKHRPQERSA